MITNRLVKHLHEEIRAPVHHQVLLLEVHMRVDDPEQLHDLLHSVEVAEVVLQRGQYVEAAVPSCLVALLDRETPGARSQRPSDECLAVVLHRRPSSDEWLDGSARMTKVDIVHLP